LFGRFTVQSANIEWIRRSVECLRNNSWQP
jgi:hypothetical protein